MKPWTGNSFAGKFLEHHACIIREIKCRIVEEANANLAVGACLDDIATENMIIEFKISQTIACSHDDCGTAHECDFSNGNRCVRWNELTSRATFPTGHIAGVTAQ